MALIYNSYEFTKKPGHLCDNELAAQSLMRGQQERSGSLFSYVSIQG
jgi:hypothetical protein